VARDGYGRLVAFVAARTGDVAGAEDALSDAFAAALRDWPAGGVPANPAAWLVTVAKRRLIDAGRRGGSAAEALRMLAEERMERAVPEEVPGEVPEVPDDRLALMFVCAHRAIDPAARAPLMLQTVLGLDAAAIAGAFLASPAAMAQRLVRAKARIRLAGIPFRLPERAEMDERLGDVLDAVYAAFAAGWTDPGGTDPRRRALAGEAIWLGRLLAELLPTEPEALGLLALMLYAEARRGARRDADGGFVPLDRQDTAAWDGAGIDAAEALLLRASRMGKVGRFQLEAAIQSAHVVRRRSGRADWPAIVRLYDGLAALTGSVVVAVNRAAALAEVSGAAAGLAALDAVAGDARLATYQPYWAARAELLARTGLAEAARAAFARAIGLEPDPVVRRFLAERSGGLG
jgi:RNA polymerase sigma-70 factor (ECF subfamily)